MQAVAKLFQLLHALCLDLFGNLPVHGRSRCARTFGVGEYVDECRAYLLQEFEFLLEQFVRLSGEACHHVESEEDLGFAGAFHLAAYVGYPVGEEGGGVFASHLGEEQVGALLEGDVEVGLELGSGGYPVDDFLGYEVGLDAGDAPSFYSFHFVQGFQQLEEGFAGAAAVVAGVYAGYHYFLDAFGGYCLSSLHRFAYGNAAAASPGIWNRAVAAEIVASVLHLQERPGPFGCRIRSEYRRPFFC